MELDGDLPFETLLELQHKLGTKQFNEFRAANGSQGGSSKKRKAKAQQHDDGSDEAPAEFSSKHPPKKSLLSVPKAVKHTRSIDPRFNPRAGKFKEDHFRKNFQFAFDLKDKELEQLKKSKNSIKNPEEKEKTKYMIQRMENQKREYLKRANKKVIINKDGTKYFPSKKEVLAKELVLKYEELKESGKLQSHLEKRRKKQAGKERKHMGIEKTSVIE